MKLPLHVEPGCNPNVLDTEQEPQHDLDRQCQHNNEENLHDGVLQEAHARIDLAAEWRQHNQLVDADPRGHEINAAHGGPEQILQQRILDAEDIRQIAIDFEDQAVMVPRHAGPETHPARTLDERADDDHDDPEDDESENEGPDGELTLLVSVVSVAKRVSVDVGHDHQPDDDEARHDHAGDPGIEVDQHLLESQEVPRRLG